MAGRSFFVARPLRIEYENAFYHITARGNERKNIFTEKKDHEKFLYYLGLEQTMN
jgi:putative transposase